jgi:2-dehydro-3-deoxyglucarate aldolase
MIEDGQTIESELDAIVQVAGLDAILVGPYDLSSSVGRPGELDHPEVLRLISRVVAIARHHAMPVGLHVVRPDVDELRRRASEGYQLLAFGTDGVFLHTSAACPDVRGTKE